MYTDITDIFWDLINHILNTKEYESIRATYAFKRIQDLMKANQDPIMLQWCTVAPWTFASAMNILEGQPITPGMTTDAYGLYFYDVHTMFMGMTDMLKRLGDPRGTRLQTCIQRMRDIWKVEEVREAIEAIL